MLRTNVRVSIAGLVVLAGVGLALAAGVLNLGSSEAEAAERCSVKNIAGSWLFATDVGQFPGPAPFSGDITALGTMNIDREGNVSGVFDVTVAEDTFAPGIPYTGSVVVSADCTGVLTFVTPLSKREDSIAIVGKNEMWGMSRDTSNLWTYDVRRIGGQSDDD